MSDTRLDLAANELGKAINILWELSGGRVQDKTPEQKAADMALDHVHDAINHILIERRRQDRERRTLVSDR